MSYYTSRYPLWRRYLRTSIFGIEDPRSDCESFSVASEANPKIRLLYIARATSLCDTFVMVGSGSSFKVGKKQCGALPYRVMPFGGAEVLLVTSRGTKRWIIPKGWPIPGLTDSESAAREAYEEAGVLGQMVETPMGSFSYEKGDDLEAGIFHVDVYPLLVDRELTLWPEAHQRQKAWVSIEQAWGMIELSGLRDLILAFKFRPKHA